MTGSPSNTDAAVDPATAATDFAAYERLLAEFLELDRNRFHARQARARADAGPSLMGGPRGIDHWTFDYVRRQIDDSLHDAATLTLEYAADQTVAPADLLPVFRDRLHAHIGAMFTAIEADLAAPAANEYGVRPSRTALAEVRRYADQRMREALTGLARGRLDERLMHQHGALARVWLRFGGSQRLFLLLAVALFIAAMWSVL